PPPPTLFPYTTLFRSSQSDPRRIHSRPAYPGRIIAHGLHHCPASVARTLRDHSGPVGRRYGIHSRSRSAARSAGNFRRRLPVRLPPFVPSCVVPSSLAIAAGL